MKKKNFTLILIHFDKEHFGKDFFLLPFYIKQVYDMDVTIVYPQTHLNEDMPTTLRGVKLYPIKHAENKSLNLYFLKVAFYLFKNARKIDVLMTFHIFMRAGKIALLYKLLNPKGKSYVKLDIPIYIADRISAFFNNGGIKAKLKKKAYKSYFKNVDLFSCESTDAYNRLFNDESLAPYFKDKLIILENGCDDQLIGELGVSARGFDEKENVFITVGRLGTFEKHTELFMQALEKTGMKGWKAYLIGPIQEEFKEYIDNFFLRNPHLKENVVFIGAIYDKKILWDIYSKAKVFVLSSRTESSGIVLYEAKIFKNYIVTTPVGASADVVGDGCGCTTDMNDPAVLSDILNSIILGKRKIDVYEGIDITQLYWSNQVKKLNLILK
ncbi:glycosyltransferase [Dysgonomonas sp. Marseille-P4677]|uniref:glycosyltransferase n=1 Tax=Dysgonomonas sp. Marseille-P4677 TaxID=2364790 RepID=UPI0019117B5A|nr:glycosyltransferase [Dysgonomonas sp. Marseille-P4677]MBK5719349.1 glycosyltransferase [Dysgonomonas sp. Marseille-P4677]